MMNRINKYFFDYVWLSIRNISQTYLTIKTRENKSQFAFETKHIQIGCNWEMVSPSSKGRKWDNCPWIRLGFPFWISFRSVNKNEGVNGFSLSIYDVSGGVNGVAFSLISGEAACNGLLFSVLCSLVGNLNGINVAPLNICFDGHNIQLGVVNWRGEDMRGCKKRKCNGIAQIGIFNKASGTSRFQIGIFNNSERVSFSAESNPYLQIGFINLISKKYSKTKDVKISHAEKKEKCFSIQIGFWNSNGNRRCALLNAMW